jgi:peptidoglycan hydrolase-like protein with peptidoglycan-binding domain
MGANTAKFSVDLSRAEAKMAGFSKSVNMKLREIGAGSGQGFDRIKKSAHEAITEVQGTSAALRSLEGAQNFRAGERFLATTLQLGPAFQKLFPIFGALALGDIVENWIEKIQEFREALKETETAPLRIAQAFRAINDPLQLTNDQLSVANDKLANEIAKLSGKPQNSLKLMLDEARVAADNLSASLNKDLEAVGKLLQENGTKWWQSLFFGTAKNDDISKQFRGEDGFGGFQKRISDITYQANQALAGIDPKSANAKTDSDNIRQKERNQLERAYGDQIAWVNQQLKERTALQQKREAFDKESAKFGPDITGQRALVTGGRPDDQRAAIAELQQLRNNLLYTRNGVALQFDNADLTAAKDRLSLKSGSPATNQFADRLAALRAQLTAAQSMASAPTGDTVASALAKGYGDAAKEIASLNQGQTKLTLGQQAQIISLHDQIALTQFRTENTKKWQATLQQISDESREMNQRDLEAATRQEEHLKQVQQQIDTINRTAANAGKGPEAIFTANYNAMPTDTPEALAERRRSLAEHQAGIAETIAGLNRQTAANQRLAAAANLGRDAQRQAAIANEQASGESPDVIAAKVAQMQSQYGLQDVQQMIGGTARDGVTRYFSEFKDNVKSTAADVHDVLGGAFDGLSSTLTAMVAGQKASWASFFSGLSAQIAAAGLNKLEGYLINLGIGFLGGMGKGGGSNPVSMGDVSFGGARAGGGDVDPNHFYLTSELGPELFVPNTSGTIIPNNKLKSGAMGGGAQYYIDARGANAVDVEARVQRALIAVHGSAVQSSAAVQQEMRLRSPRSKFA